jgi:hypothetical protein
MRKVSFKSSLYSFSLQHWNSSFDAGCRFTNIMYIYFNMFAQVVKIN